MNTVLCSTSAAATVKGVQARSSARTARAVVPGVTLPAMAGRVVFASVPQAIGQHPRSATVTCNMQAAKKAAAAAAVTIPSLAAMPALALVC